MSLKSQKIGKIKKKIGKLSKENKFKSTRKIVQ